MTAGGGEGQPTPPPTAPPPTAAPVVAGPGHRRGLVAAVAAAVVALDQLTKAWAVAALGDGPVALLGGARLALAYNRGAAFGLGGDLVPVLAVGALAVVGILALRGDATADVGVALALGGVLGGALGNLTDRLARGPGLLDGAVVDFVDLRWWPVFNLADVAITVGTIALVLLGLRGERSPRPFPPEA